MKHGSSGEPPQLLWRRAPWSGSADSLGGTLETLDSGGAGSYCDSPREQVLSLLNLPACGGQADQSASQQSLYSNDENWLIHFDDYCRQMLFSGLLLPEDLKAATMGMIHQHHHQHHQLQQQQQPGLHQQQQPPPQPPQLRQPQPRGPAPTAEQPSAEKAEMQLSMQRGAFTADPPADLLAAGTILFQRPDVQLPSSSDCEDAAAAPSATAGENKEVGDNALHPTGCKPCAFRWTKGCANGDSCPFCHEWHPPRKKKPMRDQKNLMIIARKYGKIEFLRCSLAEALQQF